MIFVNRGSELTGELVELEREGDGEEEELVYDSDQGRDCKIVIVQNMNHSHGEATRQSFSSSTMNRRID